MKSNRLIVLVEGTSDEDFIEWIIKPILIRETKYSDVITYRYAKMPKKINESYVENVVNMHDDILCLADITGFPCKSAKKENVQTNHIGNIGNDKIVIVVREIESWYLAGISQSCCKRLKIDYLSRTDKINKTKFSEIIAKSKYKPRQVCILEMLRNYEVELAKSKNKSFHYMHKKYLS